MYGNCPKILNTLFHTFWAFLLFYFYYYFFFLAVFSGLPNSVGPDQTAPEEQSDLGLHSLHMPFVRNFSVQNFRTFTVYIILCHFCVVYIVNLLLRLFSFNIFFLDYSI